MPTYFSISSKLFSDFASALSLAAAHVEILNSGSRSKVGAEIQNYPNTEMPNYRKAEIRLFRRWGYMLEFNISDLKGEARLGRGAEIPEKFLILGNY